MESNPSKILYYQRGSKKLYEEIVLGEKFIKWAYQNPTISFLSGIFFRFGILSQIYGYFLDSRLSKKKIRKTIKELQVDPQEFEDPIESFCSFNEFFIRKLKSECRPFDPDPTSFSSPAEGRCLVYPKISKDIIFPVKGIEYSVNQLLNSDSADFHDGSMIIIRLCPADYHRFHFPCDGEIIHQKNLPGSYHSVNPIALAKNINVFCENKRTITTLNSKQFEKIAYIEVGAFGVGSIVQTYRGNSIKKMQEKGYFKFGGSTVILLLQKDKLEIDEELIRNSQSGFETLIKVGETLGRGE